MDSPKKDEANGNFFAAMSGFSIFSNAMKRSVKGVLADEGLESINPQGGNEDVEEEAQEGRRGQEVNSLRVGEPDLRLYSKGLSGPIPGTGEGVQKILGVPYPKRKVKSLLKVDVLSRTSACAAHAEPSREFPSKWVRKGMVKETEERKRVLSDDELYAGVSGKKARVEMTPIVEVPDSPKMKDVSIDVVSPGTSLALVSGGFNKLPTDLIEKGSRISLGESAYVFLGPNAIAGEMRQSVSATRNWIGGVETSARGLGHILEATRDLFLVNQNCARERQDLQDVHDVAIKKVQDLEASLDSEKKKVAELVKAQADMKVTHAGEISELESKLLDKDEKFKNRVKILELRAIANTMLEFLQEFKSGRREWDYAAKMERCENLFRCADWLEDTDSEISLK